MFVSAGKASLIAIVCVMRNRLQAAIQLDAFSQTHVKSVGLRG